MHSLALLVAAASLGVDYGWQPTDDGQLEYIIQMEPAVIELLKQGQEVISEIHPDAKGVRRFRILVGKGDLPRQGLPEKAAEPEEMPAVEQQVKRTLVRGAGQAFRNGGFLPDLEPGPADDEAEPAEEPAPPPRAGRRVDPAFNSADDETEVGAKFPPAKRRLTKDFRLPAAPDDDEGSLDPLQPDPLETGSAIEPLKHRQVGHTEQVGSRDDSSQRDTRKQTAIKSEGTKPEEKGTSLPPQVVPAKPWLPLTITLLLLFGSLGGNAYLAWLARDFYSRYRALSDELRGPRAVEA